MLVRGAVGFGHRRLKIIDLSERAAQPMTDPALGLSVAFNGCIYNYRALRGELEGLGYRFFSEGDTEVVLKAWHAWGETCPERFNGMFAFAVHERDSGRVILARDRLGIARAPPIRLDVAGAARRRRRRHRHRSGGAQLLPLVPRGGAAAVHHPEGCA
jgi:asparagine synthase (glutamine-hydrolysing)